MPPRPLDHPYPGRPHRVYVAVTNHCNRSCAWCSTCSSPRGRVFMTRKAFAAALPRIGPFELQLEGGEPTLHPRLGELVELARFQPNCTRLVLCTNGVVAPRQAKRLRDWIAVFGEPFTLKLSVNHHLMERDAGHVTLARLMAEAFDALGGARLLVINARLRRGYANDDRAVREAVEEAGLAPRANFFFLQRYGFAANETGWDSPAPVWHGFTLVNPDGRAFGQDLFARTEAMRMLD